MGYLQSGAKSFSNILVHFCALHKLSEFEFNVYSKVSNDSYTDTIMVQSLKTVFQTLLNLIEWCTDRFWLEISYNYRVLYPETGTSHRN